MVKKKELPKGLLDKQERDKEKTYEKINAAAQRLKEEGRAITRPSLTKESGLSGGLFSKEHVKKFLLKRWGIGADEVPASELTLPEDLNIKDIGELVKTVVDLKGRLQSTEDKLDKESDTRKKIEANLGEAKYENKILRGELDIAMRKLRVVLGKKPKAQVIKLFAELKDMKADAQDSDE